jgi:NAD-dependent SIR2 family protein deacetylase
MNPPRFKEFQRIVFFSGAGMSAESGVPTYRGQGGIWSEYNYQDYACQPAFDRDPERLTAPAVRSAVDGAMFVVIAMWGGVNTST